MPTTPDNIDLIAAAAPQSATRREKPHLAIIALQALIDGEIPDFDDETPDVRH